jgi:hypothetical protein
MVDSQIVVVFMNLKRNEWIDAPEYKIEKQNFQFKNKTRCFRTCQLHGISSV